MNVQALRQTIVTLMPCVPTRKVLMCVVVKVDTPGTVKTAQVGHLITCTLYYVLVYLTRMMLINLNSTVKVIYHKLRKYDLITLATLHMIFILLATLAGNVNSSLRSLSGECCCVCEVSLVAPAP